MAPLAKPIFLSMKVLFGDRAPLTGASGETAADRWTAHSPRQERNSKAHGKHAARHISEIRNRRISSAHTT